MTDATPFAGQAPLHDSSSPQSVRPDPGRPDRRRHPAARSRIAATGIGVAAMLGLVSTMEVNAGWTHGTNKVAAPTTSQHDDAAAVRSAAARARLAAAAIPRPIVLTPRAVVHTVNVRGATSSGYSSGPASAAAAPAAPVASTGGSR